MRNEDKLLIQVVPRLTPTRCGVSDHAIALADALKSSFGIESAFVVVNSEERWEVPYRTVYCVPSQLLSSCCLLSGRHRSALLVHVSGYGYSRDGAPKELADAVVQLHDNGRFPLAAYFHELYYLERTPWKSAFWHSSRQRREVGRIARICSLLVTNTAQHTSWLQNEKQHGAAVTTLPVFSNVGEAAEVVAWEDREPALIVFGQSDTRRRAYQQLTGMGDLLARLAVREIIDVGADADAPQSIAGLRVRRMGRMPANELRELISRTRFGFVRFRPNEMAKSSVMASLCAFGTVPVLADSFTGEIDGISDGKQLVTPKTAYTCSLEECSLAAWNWYQQHNVVTHARVYSQWMGNKNVREVVAG